MTGNGTSGGSAGNTRINPAELATPSGFAHAVLGPPGARPVLLAGQTALDRDGRIVAPGDVVAQFRQCLSNLLAALRAAGGGPQHLASITIYIVDVPGYRARAREIGALWRELCGREYPAAAGVGVARLWDDEALVEISGIALLPPA